MFRVTREIKFCFGHRLLGYDGKCRQLHGHNARALFTVGAGKLDRLGMATDFARIKKTMNAWIDANWDHRSLLHRDDPLLGALQAAGEPVVGLPVNPTTENLARLLFDQALALGVPVEQVVLWENDMSCAAYATDGAATLQDDADEPASHGASSCGPLVSRRQGEDSIPGAPAGGPYFVTRELKFCFGHRLHNYDGKCRQLHGHNGRLLLTVEAAELDAMGMATDFGRLKTVQRWLDAEWDHAMLLRRGDPLVELLRRHDCAVVELDANPTTENLARIIHETAAAADLAVVSAQLWETDLCAAGYAPAFAPAYG